MENTQVLEVLKTHSYPKGYAHTVYIDESIDEPLYYRNVINTLDNAQDGDSVRMIISTGGGRMDTANMITYSMDSCKAEITAVLSSSCMSAGTIIALHAHKWEVGAGLDWMVHNGSFGVGGETHSVRKYHDHNQKIMRSMLDREYTGFYSPEEIEAIANGEDSLLLAEEVGIRLDKFALYKQNQVEDYHQEMDNALWEENNRTIDEALEDLEISSQEKEAFIKVRDMLDDNLSEEPCTNSEDESTYKEVNINGTMTLKYLQDTEGNNYGFELDYTFCGEDCLLYVAEEYLSADDREDLLFILSEVTDLKELNRRSTANLIKRFISEIKRYAD
jgi:ATP-dependent protease ClpP protease subunit